MGSIPLVWYENDSDERWFPDMRAPMPPDPPAGFDYMHSRSPCSLRHTILHGNREIAALESSWQADLVLAMVRPTPQEAAEAVRRYGSPGPVLDLPDAVIRAAGCEHCINTLAHRYGLGWGYAHGSDEDRSGTSCEFCTAEPPAAPAPGDLHAFFNVIEARVAVEGMTTPGEGDADLRRAFHAWLMGFGQRYVGASVSVERCEIVD